MIVSYEERTTETELQRLAFRGRAAVAGHLVGGSLQKIHLDLPAVGDGAGFMLGRPQRILFPRRAVKRSER